MNETKSVKLTIIGAQRTPMCDLACAARQTVAHAQSFHQHDDLAVATSLIDLILDLILDLTLRGCLHLEGRDDCAIAH